MKTAESKMEQAIASGNFSPFRDRLLVKYLQGDSQTEGGIIIPDTARHRGWEAVVMAVGPGFWNNETGEYVPIPDVEVGDHVLVAKYTGADISVDGEDYTIVQPGELMGIFR